MQQSFVNVLLTAKPAKIHTEMEKKRFNFYILLHSAGFFLLWDLRMFQVICGLSSHPQVCLNSLPWDSGISILLLIFLHTTLIKKENLIFLIYKENSEGSVVKSYMTDGLLVQYIRKPFLTSEFPYICGKFLFLFYQCMFYMYEHYHIVSIVLNC